MAYVYIRSEPGLRTVGFYRPDGKWEPESDHDSPDKAAARVAYLNGGGGAALELLAALRRIADDSEPCECAHDDEHCCALKADYCCPMCIAAVALKKAGA